MPRAWKHHIAEHFEEGSLITDAYPAIGSTVFTDYNLMIDYLKKDGRKWYIAELIVEANEIKPFKNGYMASILVLKKPLKPFQLLKETE